MTDVGHRYEGSVEAIANNNASVAVVKQARRVAARSVHSLIPRAKTTYNILDNSLCFGYNKIENDFSRRGALWNILNVHLKTNFWN
jgi:hypothetical protein